VVDGDAKRQAVARNRKRGATPRISTQRKPQSETREQAGTSRTEERQSTAETQTSAK